MKFKIKNIWQILTIHGEIIKLNIIIIIHFFEEILILLCNIKVSFPQKNVKSRLNLEKILHIFFSNSKNLLQTFIIFNFIYTYVYIYGIIWLSLSFEEGYLLMDDISPTNSKPLNNNGDGFSNLGGPNNENNDSSAYKSNSLKKEEDKIESLDKGKNKRVFNTSSEEDNTENLKKVKFNNVNSEHTFNPKSPVSRTSSPISVTSSMTSDEIEKEMTVNPFYKLYYQEEIMKRFGKGRPIREEALKSLVLNAASYKNEIPAGEAKDVLKDHLPGLIWELRELSNNSDNVLSESAKKLGEQFEKELVEKELAAKNFNNLSQNNKK